jgi:nitroimidazol reductase NimA-like FMN-containing flavoprotein (pyridoxamine 5'-phosphate oxidase superfamily)
MRETLSAIPFVSVRRRDRAITDEAWIGALLGRAAMGLLATVADGKPFLNANLFVFDPVQYVIYMHTARAGQTHDHIASEALVCFTVNEMGRLLPAAVALEMSVEYAGVVVFGRATVVGDEAEAAYGLQLLLDKYFPHLQPGADYRPIQPDSWRAQRSIGSRSTRGAASRNRRRMTSPARFSIRQNRPRAPVGWPQPRRASLVQSLCPDASHRGCRQSQRGSPAGVPQ